MDKQTLSQDCHNLRAYQDPDVVRGYAMKENPELFASEVAILNVIGGDLRGGAILDLGVGGGRSTPHLSSMSRRYLGVDYSGPMVEACQMLYPDLEFAQCDARSLGSLGSETFDTVVFLFNGIDHVGHRDRQVILDQVYRKLKPGGLFWFSSHNLSAPNPRPWHLSHYRWGHSLATSLWNVVAAVQRTWNYWRRAAAAHAGDGYAVRVDEAHEFRLVTYHVNPAAQVRQLESHGFTDARVFDFHGHEQPADAAVLSESAHVHFVARRQQTDV